ncbi:hypothetical protein D3C81_1765810 [compost metagenome]
MHAAILHQQRQTAGVTEHRRLGKIEPGGILQRPVHAEQQQIQRDVIEHDAGEDFVGIEARAQPRGQPGPRRACDGAGEQNQHQRPTALHIDDVHRQSAAGESAEEQLTFGADVPDPRLIRHRQAQCAEQNRQRLDQ